MKKKFEPGQIVEMERNSIGNRALYLSFIVIESWEDPEPTAYDNSNFSKVYCIESYRQDMVGEVYTFNDDALSPRELNNG
jgi:hypothetical protein